MAMFGQQRPSLADIVAYLRSRAPSPGQVAEAMPATHAAAEASTGAFRAFGGDLAQQYRQTVGQLQAPPPGLGELGSRGLEDLLGGAHLAADAGRMVASPLLGLWAGTHEAARNALPAAPMVDDASVRTKLIQARNPHKR